MNPYTTLEKQLLDAARRHQPMAASTSRATAAKRRERLTLWGARWRARDPRSLLALLATLVVAGSAAAAVFSLAGSRSQPLVGKVPGVVKPPSVAGHRYTISVAGYHYTITVLPSLYTGTAGWATSITYSTNSGRGGPFGTGGGGGYATATNPLFGGSAFSGGSGTIRGQTVDYVLTSPSVLALRIGNRTIRTLSSPSLPAGDRAAVFFVPARWPTLVPWRSGMPARGYMTVRGCPCRHGRAVSVKGKLPFLAILPLDRYGHVIATNVSERPYGLIPSFWQAPSAVTPRIHESPYHGATQPRPGVCELAQHGLPGLVGEWGGTISTISPTEDALGEVFLSCINTEYYLHGWPLDVAVLLDGRRPGQVLGPIPGAQPVPGHPNTVNLATGSLTAKRAGNAWLVAEGGSGLPQRIAVLNALQISKLDLHHLNSGHLPYSNAPALLG